MREGETLEDLETRIHQLGWYSHRVLMLVLINLSEWPAIVEGTKIAIERVLRERGEKKVS